MALLNGIYIFVKNENVDYALDVTDHPVEKGINISDHARRQSYTISLSGEIVGEDAAKKRSQVETMLNNASLISYQGRNIKTNGIIKSFSTGHPYSIKGGCSFEMTIKEVRVANSSGYLGNVTPTTKKTTPVKDTQETGTQKVEKNSTTDEVYKTKNGDSIYNPFLVRADKKYSTILELNKKVDPMKVESGTTLLLSKSRERNLAERNHGGKGGSF